MSTLAEVILAHQNEAAPRHADETSWRVQAYRERGRSSRAWLWISVSDDAVYFHIDPSRSAEVAMKLFGSVKDTVVLVCDRLSTYTREGKLWLPCVVKSTTSLLVFIFFYFRIAP